MPTGMGVFVSFHFRELEDETKRLDSEREALRADLDACIRHTHDLETQLKRHTHENHRPSAPTIPVFNSAAQERDLLQRGKPIV